MGLNMYLSKINKKVCDIQEFNDCIEAIGMQNKKSELIKVLDDFSKLATPDFLEKHYSRSLLQKSQKFIKDDYLRKEFELELSEYYIDNVKVSLASIGDLDINIIRTNLCYWAKRSDLNSILEDMYYNRGGEDEFNNKYLLLSKEDIIDIIELHKEHLDGKNEISHNYGFFWEQTTLEDLENSLKDFEKVLQETNWDNETVYYHCWW